MKVVATARKPEEFKDLSATYGDSIPAVKLDVTSPADAEKAVATAVSSEGSRHERARLVIVRVPRAAVALRRAQQQTVLVARSCVLPRLVARVAPPRTVPHAVTIRRRGWRDPGF
jgi:hypothetical protein